MNQTLEAPTVPTATVRDYLLANLRQTHIADLPNKNQLHAILIRCEIGSHTSELGRIPYLVTPDAPANSHANMRSAVYRAKKICIEIGAIPTNLSHFEPACPICNNTFISWSKNGKDMRCNSCNHEQHPSVFWSGDIDITFLVANARSIKP